MSYYSVVNPDMVSNPGALCHYWMDGMDRKEGKILSKWREMPLTYLHFPSYTKKIGKMEGVPRFQDEEIGIKNTSHLAGLY